MNEEKSVVEVAPIIKVMAAADVWDDAEEGVEEFKLLRERRRQ